MSRKETESERDTEAKWRKVAKIKENYNQSLLPAADDSPPAPTGEVMPSVKSPLRASKRK